MQLEPMRARRRRLKVNAVNRAKQIVKKQWSLNDEIQILDRARKWADNLKKCSCHLCCNPRRNPFSKSIDRMRYFERAAWLDLLEQYDEFSIRPPKMRDGKFK
jgi:hypothetical protein